MYSYLVQISALCSTLYDKARCHLSLSGRFLNNILTILGLRDIDSFTLPVSVAMATLLA
jgi:hypothetical protein